MTTNVVVPQLGESVLEATVGTWLKQEGDSVAVGDALVELQTDKVDVEVGAETAGVLVKIERQEGEDVEIGDVLAQIEENGSAPASAPAEAEAEPAAEAEAEEAEAEPAAIAEPAAPARDGERATPVARRVAQEQGIDLAEVSGSGRGGQITKQDVESYAARQKEDGREEPAPAPAREREPAATQPAGPAVTLAAPPEPRREERERMSRRRRTIARRLVEVQQTAAILTTFNEVDMSAVIEMRRRRQEKFVERHGIKLGFMSFFVKACIGALKAFPRLNAEIDGDEMIIKHYYDIGIAVGVEEGLVVPVVRDADRLSFAEIEQQIKELAQKAQDGSLTLEELRGGTFTITNGGIFGSMLSTPILNPPQVGILGMHNIVERPVVVNGEVVIRPVMYVALSYDHRIVDGREAVLFLVRVKELIEDPEKLLLEG